MILKQIKLAKIGYAFVLGSIIDDQLHFNKNFEEPLEKLNWRQFAPYCTDAWAEFNWINFSYKTLLKSWKKQQMRYSSNA